MKYQNINQARRGLDEVIKQLMGKPNSIESIQQSIKNWVLSNFDLDENFQPKDQQNKIMLLQIRGVLYPKHIANSLGVAEFTKSSASYLHDVVADDNPDVFLKGFPYQPSNRDDLRKETTLRVQQLSEGVARVTNEDESPKTVTKKYTTISEARLGLDDLIKGLMKSQTKPDVNAVNEAINKWVAQHFNVDEDKTLLLQIRGVIYPRHIKDSLGVVEFSKESAAFLREIAGANNTGAYIEAFPFKPANRDEQRQETTLRVKQLLEGAPRAPTKNYTPKPYTNIIDARKGLDELIQSLKSSQIPVDIASANRAIKKWVKQHFSVDEKGFPQNDETKTLLLQIRGAIYPKNITHGLGLLEFTKSSAEYLRDLAKNEQAGPDVFYNTFIYKPDKNDLLREHVFRSRQLNHHAQGMSSQNPTQKFIEPILIPNQEWQKNVDKIYKDFNHSPFSEQLERYMNLVSKQEGATSDRILKAMGAYLQEYAKLHFEDYREEDDAHPINVAFNAYTLDSFKERLGAYNLSEVTLEAFYNYDFNEHLQKGRAMGSRIAMISAAEKSLQSTKHLESGKQLLAEIRREKDKHKSEIPNVVQPGAKQSDKPSTAKVKKLPDIPSQKPRARLASIVLPALDKEVGKQVSMLLDNMNDILESQQKEKSSNNRLVRSFKKALQRKNDKNHKVLMKYYIKSIKSYVAMLDVVKDNIKSPTDFIDALNPLMKFLHEIEMADLKEINVNSKHQRGIKNLANELRKELVTRTNEVVKIANSDTRNAIYALADSEVELEKLKSKNASQSDIERQTDKVASLKNTVEKMKIAYFSLERKAQQVVVEPLEMKPKNSDTKRTSSLQRAKELLRNPPILSHLRKKIADQEVAREKSKDRVDQQKNRKSINEGKKKPR